jgi:hypothetical protein
MSYHGQNRRSSWLVRLETESIKGLANVTDWLPDCSRGAPYVTVVSPPYTSPLFFFAVTGLLPSAEEASVFGRSIVTPMPSRSVRILLLSGWPGHKQRNRELLDSFGPEVCASLVKVRSL